MRRKKRKITQEVKLLIWANWDCLTKAELRHFIGCGNVEMYEVAKEQLKVKEQPHIFYKFWKPYLDKLLKDNKPFILQEVCKKYKLTGRYLSLGANFFRNYRRKHPKKILFTHIYRNCSIVYTENSRVKAWNKLIKTGAIKKDHNYYSRFGKAILGKHIGHTKAGMGKKEVII